ncbi:hypothetical protein JG687_00018503, partial [Phytophthora cactorum]
GPAIALWTNYGERGAREAGPRGIRGGGPSAELHRVPHIVLSITSYLYIASESKRGAEGVAKRGWLLICMIWVLTLSRTSN